MRLQGSLLEHSAAVVKMRLEPEISGVSVVLVGNFNPAIFTPAWFTLHKLLPQSAAEHANLEVAHRQLSVFSVDWLSLQVRPEQFAVETQQAPYTRLLDFVTLLFGRHLSHSPITEFGSIGGFISKLRVLRREIDLDERWFRSSHGGHGPVIWGSRASVEGCRP